MCISGQTYVLLVVGAALLIGLLIYRKRQPLPGTGIETKFSLVAFLLGHAPLIVGCVLGYVVVATLLPALILAAASPLLVRLDELDQPLGFGGAFWAVAPTILWGLLSLVVTVPLIILWLRYRERRDSSLDAPHVNERLLREMIKREDWVAQNHMGSLLPIRSGVLRATILHAGHLGLGLLLRVVAREGYLGSMRTVHFAHWAFLNNDSRLLFFSNFDHSWDSYLDDFIEKAHVGLTLAWGCGVGFPPTRFLIYDGASHGRQFKNWALASRAVSRFWYSAYPALTVDQIERNYRVANGLRQPSLIEKEAWSGCGIYSSAYPAGADLEVGAEIARADAGAGRQRLWRGDRPGAIPADRLAGCGRTCSGAWLTALEAVAPVTSAVPPSNKEPSRGRRRSPSPGRASSAWGCRDGARLLLAALPRGDVPGGSAAAPG